MKSSYYFILSFIFSVSSVSIAQTSESSGIFYGVTITSIKNLGDITESLARLSKKPTARIVFDEWVPAKQYAEAVKEIHKVSFTMGEVLDSYAMNEYSINEYLERVNEYIDMLGDDIDIWEIGNEVNGEWLGSSKDIREKLKGAFEVVKSHRKKGAITLFYNENCYEDENNEMYTWVRKNITNEMKEEIDYVFVSYYSEDCNGYEPDWQYIFDSLHTMFPNSKLGVGECGTKNKSSKKPLMKKYYGMEIQTPNYIGGYFWWYFNRDCVPYTKELWNVLNETIK